MKQVVTITTIFLFLFLSNPSFSQFSGSRNGVSINAIGLNYHALYKDDLNMAGASNFDYSTFGMKIGYHRNLIGDYLNLEVPLSFSRVRVPNIDTDYAHRPLTNLKHRASLGGLLQLQYFKPNNILVPYFSLGLVGSNIKDNGDFHMEIPIGVGLDVRLKNGIYFQVRPEYRIGLIDDMRNDLNLNAGFKFFWNGKAKENLPAPPPTPPAPAPVNNDRDNDGVLNINDKCPDLAGVASLAGCPDSDGDGIANSDDACPELAGLKSLAGCPDSDSDGLADNKDNCPNEAGPKTNNGCPFGDSDGDGVNDNVDKCPKVAGKSNLGGCPDSDGDGVIDSRDSCPNVSGKKSLAGCPDSDNDGIKDSDDKCPNTKGVASNNGCPKVTKAEVEKKLSFAARNIQFETSSSNLKQSSYQIMDEVANILLQHPEFKVSIGGHTDDRGAADMNQKLSEKRAISCMNYLSTKGISASRMSAVGYGETQPITTNDTSDGRKQNRRVVFTLFQ